MTDSYQLIPTNDNNGLKWVSHVYFQSIYSDIITKKMYIYISSTNCCNIYVNPLSANIKKWSKTLKQFVGKLLTNCLNVFDHFMGLALKGLKWWKRYSRCYILTFLLSEKLLFNSELNQFSGQSNYIFFHF